MPGLAAINMRQSPRTLDMCIGKLKLRLELMCIVATNFLKNFRGERTLGRAHGGPPSCTQADESFPKSASTVRCVKLIHDGVSAVETGLVAARPKISNTRRTVSSSQGNNINARSRR